MLAGNKSYNFRSYARRKIQMIYCTGMKERSMPGGRRDRGGSAGGGGGGGGGLNAFRIQPHSSSSSSSLLGGIGGANQTIDGIEMWKD